MLASSLNSRRLCRPLALLSFFAFLLALFFTLLLLSALLLLALLGLALLARGLAVCTFWQLPACTAFVLEFCCDACFVTLGAPPKGLRCYGMAQ